MLKLSRWPEAGSSGWAIVERKVGLEDEEPGVWRKNTQRFLGAPCHLGSFCKRRPYSRQWWRPAAMLGLGPAWEEGALIPRPSGRSRGAGESWGGTEASGVQI